MVAHATSREHGAPLSRTASSSFPRRRESSILFTAIDADTDGAAAETCLDMSANVDYAGGLASPPSDVSFYYYTNAFGRVAAYACKHSDEVIYEYLVHRVFGEVVYLPVVQVGGGDIRETTPTSLTDNEAASGSRERSLVGADYRGPSRRFASNDGTTNSIGTSSFRVDSASRSAAGGEARSNGKSDASGVVSSIDSAPPVEKCPAASFSNTVLYVIEDTHENGFKGSYSQGWIPIGHPLHASKDKLQMTLGQHIHLKYAYNETCHRKCTFTEIKEGTEWFSHFTAHRQSLLYKDPSGDSTVSGLPSCIGCTNDAKYTITADFEWHEFNVEKYDENFVWARTQTQICAVVAAAASAMCMATGPAVFFCLAEVMIEAAICMAVVDWPDNSDSSLWDRKNLTNVYEIKEECSCKCDLSAPQPVFCEIDPLTSTMTKKKGSTTTKIDKLVW